MSVSCYRAFGWRGRPWRWSRVFQASLAGLRWTKESWWVWPPLMKYPWRHNCSTHRGHCNTLLFCRLQFRALTANTKVLIRVITLNSNNDLGQEFGAIEHITLPAVDGLDDALMTKMSNFSNGFLCWENFYQYLFCVSRPNHYHIWYQSIASLLHINPLKSFSVSDLLAQISKEWEDFKSCFVRRMQNITQRLSL